MHKIHLERRSKLLSQTMCFRKTWSSIFPHYFIELFLIWNYFSCTEQNFFFTGHWVVIVVKLLHSNFNFFKKSKNDGYCSCSIREFPVRIKNEFMDENNTYMNVCADGIYEIVEHNITKSRAQNESKRVHFYAHERFIERAKKSEKKESMVIFIVS